MARQIGERKNRMKYAKEFMGIRVTADMQKNVETVARKNHMSVSETVRKFIEKGLEIEGYTQDVDCIAGIVRQEIKAQLAPPIDRLVKIQMKAAKISAGMYYLLLKILMELSVDRIVSLKELATDTRKLGVKCMH